MKQTMARLLRHRQTKGAVTARSSLRNAEPVLSSTLPFASDALIAATALVHSAELFTLNTKDFWFIASLRLHTPQTC